MKQLLATLLFIASTIYTTSCGTIYIDAIPVEVSTMEIPAEGGHFFFVSCAPAHLNQHYLRTTLAVFDV